MKFKNDGGDNRELNFTDSEGASLRINIASFKCQAPVLIETKGGINGLVGLTRKELRKLANKILKELK